MTGVDFFAIQQIFMYLSSAETECVKGNTFNSAGAEGGGDKVFFFRRKVFFLLLSYKF